MNTVKRLILVDYENIQRIDFQPVDTANTSVIIFVGRSQSKIPFSLVEKAQAMGSKLRWVKISGDGKNNLDFHIAFELGRLSEKAEPGTEFIILSKDSGYDALIQFVKHSGIRVRRITNIAELPEGERQLPRSKFTHIIVANLKKINSQKLPRTRRTLKKHIESLLRDKANPDEIELVIEEMFVKGQITQSNQRLKYRLPREEQ